MVIYVGYCAIGTVLYNVRLTGIFNSYLPLRVASSLSRYSAYLSEDGIYGLRASDKEQWTCLLKLRDGA